MNTEKERIVRSDKYLNWLVEFTECTYNKCWDDETVEYSKVGCSEYDINNARLFSTFVDYARELAEKQYVVTLPHQKHADYRFDIKLRGNYYEITCLNSRCVYVIKKIYEPEGKLVFIDEPIDSKTLKDREFIQYILVNKDIDVPASVLAVHVAHATTICAMKEQKKAAFDIWYKNNQKVVILDASKEKIEEMEKVGYGIRDTGHNNIPKNSLIAISLGIIPRAKALTLTKNCTLHKD